MKTLILTILTICACTEHVHPEIEIIDMPKDYCDGNRLVEHSSPWDSTIETCKFGCAEDLETAWCKSPCDDVVCKEPEIKKACDEFKYLLEYRSECVETAEAPHYECIPVVSTRRYCGCYDEPTPHCYGD